MPRGTDSAAAMALTYTFKNGNKYRIIQNSSLVFRTAAHSPLFKARKTQAACRVYCYGEGAVACSGEQHQEATLSIFWRTQNDLVGRFFICRDCVILAPLNSNIFASRHLQRHVGRNFVEKSQIDCLLLHRASKFLFLSLFLCI